jgi:hypothetical protein
VTTSTGATRTESSAIGPGGDNVASDRDGSRGRPYDLPGSEMQSKDAGVRALASPVEAAGGESTG